MPRQIALQHFGTGYRHELHFKPLIIINNKSAVGNNRKLLNYMLSQHGVSQNLISNSRPKATFFIMIALHCSNLFGHDKHLLNTEIDLYACQSSRRQRQQQQHLHGKRPFQYGFGLRCRFWWLMPQWLTHTDTHTDTQTLSSLTLRQIVLLVFCTILANIFSEQLQRLPKGGYSADLGDF